MLKTYFFVPANRIEFVEKSQFIQSDYLIFDLEDSVAQADINIGIYNLKNIKPTQQHFVRPSFFHSKSKMIDEDLIKELVNLGFTGFIIPKFSDIAQLEEIKRLFESFSTNTSGEFRFILLIEHPAGLLCVQEVVRKNILPIVALGLGNHDYCNAMGMKHNLPNLYYARQMILNISKAYGLSSIDIVSLDYKNEKSFLDESFDGFSMGFDSKFIIHPNQLEYLKKIQYYTDEEISEAQSIYPQILEMIQDKSSLVTYQGKVFEKPHINRVLQIINWYNSYGNK